MTFRSRVALVLALFGTTLLSSLGYAIPEGRGIKARAMRAEFFDAHNTNYRVTIPRSQNGYAIRNQRSSGRCWIFAFDGILQSELSRRGIKPDAISTSFLNYHSLRQRAYFALDLAETKKISPKKVSAEISEGGFYSYAATIVKDFGVVPESVMPSTHDADNSKLLLHNLQRVVSRAARAANAIPLENKEARTAVIQGYRNSVDRLLAEALGTPPETFTVDGTSYTPKRYFSEGLNLNEADFDYITLSHNPTLKNNRRYIYQNGVIATKQTQYNVSMRTLQQSLKRAIRQGNSAYIAINVDAGNPHNASSEQTEIPGARGVLSVAAFDYDQISPDLAMRKHERVEDGFFPANHAMTITAFDPAGKKGYVKKWLVDNSWGERSPSTDQGRFHMYDDYLREYVDHIAVPRSAVSPALLEKMDRLSDQRIKRRKIE